MKSKRNLFHSLLIVACTPLAAHAANIDVIGNSAYSTNSFASANNGADGGLGTNIRVITGTNVTWTKNNTYFVTDKLFIPKGATLTIEAGTKVYFSSDTKGTTVRTDDAVGSITACRGGKLIADGTAAAPIVFTSVREWEALNNVDSSFDVDTNIGPAPTSADAGQWGGIILLGQAFTSFVNSTGVNAGTVQVEGFAPAGSASYDGDSIPDATQYGVSTNFPLNNADNSGIIRYCSIRHGGYEFASAKEINGLTLGAVGSGTTIEYVEVYANQDDGIEFFGGTVNTNNLVMAFNQDDSFDIDEGYRGVNQFWFGIQNPGSADAGGEWDGVGGTSAGYHLGSDTATNHANPVIYNGTFIGAGRTNTLSQLPLVTGQVNWEKGNFALHIEDYFAGEIYNSVFDDYAEKLIKYNDSGKSTGVKFKFKHNTIGRFGSTTTSGNNASYTTGTGPTNTIFDAFGEPLDGNSNGGVNPGYTAYTRNGSNFLTAITPVPASNSPLIGSATSTAGGAPVAVSYRGAFAPGSNTNWAAGWTKLSQSGVLTGSGPSTTATIADADNDGISDDVETTYASLGFNPALSDASVLQSLKTTAEFNANRTAGQNDVTTSPATYSLYTASQFDVNRTAGQNDVTGNPAAYSLYTANSIQDLRTVGQAIVQAGASKVNLSLPVQKSTGLNTWEAAGSLSLEIDKISNKEFYRIQVDGAAN
jgi:hypothetical protein